MFSGSSAEGRRRRDRKRRFLPSVEGIRREFMLHRTCVVIIIHFSIFSISMSRNHHEAPALKLAVSPQYGHRKLTGPLFPVRSRHNVCSHMAAHTAVCWKRRLFTGAVKFEPTPYNNANTVIIVVDRRRVLLG